MMKMMQMKMQMKTSPVRCTPRTYVVCRMHHKKNPNGVMMLENVKTLVLSAGNMHGIMYVGVYKVLFGRLPNVQNYVTCSIGAVFGFMMVLGYTPEEMWDITVEILCNEGLPPISLIGLARLWGEFGLDDGQFKRKVFQKILSKKHHSCDITFAELAKKTGKNFVVCGANVSKSRLEGFNFITHPRMSVVEAIHISTCIPVIFKPVMYNGDMYLDGAVFDSTPVSLVCDRRDKHDTLAFVIQVKPIETMTNLLDFFNKITHFYSQGPREYDCHVCNISCHDLRRNSVQTSWFGRNNSRVSVEELMKYVACGESQTRDFLGKSNVNAVDCQFGDVRGEEVQL